jgi:sigma-B regulation protein RsbU (phosphoserine phosphatase)
MKTKKYHSLATRLSFWITLLGALVFISVLSVNYYHSHRLIDSYVEKLARSDAASTVRKIESTINTVATNADSLASVIANTRIDDDQIHQAIKSFLTINPAIFGMTVALEPNILNFNHDGFSPYYFRKNSSLEYANLATEDYQYLEQDWYTKPKSINQSTWSDPYIDTGGGDVLMTTYSTPILIGSNKQFAGVATADVELGWLNEVVKDLASSNSGLGLIVSGNDKIIAHPDESFVMQPLKSLLKKEGFEQNWDIYQTSKTSTSPIYKKVSCRIHEGRCWIAIESLGKTGWKIIIAYSEDELISKMNALTIDVAIIAIAGLITLLLTVIFITRYFTKPLSQLAIATKSIGKGDLNAAMPQPQHEDEIGSLTTDFSDMRNALKNYIKELQESTAKRQKLESEIQIAKDIQMSMIPGAGNASIKGGKHQLYSLLRPARSVGGDLYYFQLSEDGVLNFIIGDVSDKGVPAALFMAKTVTLYTQALRDKLTPGECLTMMNDLLSENNDACMFVTALCGAMDTKTGNLVMSNAGHMHPILKTTSSTSELEINGATALGLIDGISYPNISAQLEENTTLVMYTDGISEAFNSNEEQYSEERILEFVRNQTPSNAENLGHRIISDVDQYANVSEQSDDITLMVIFYECE